MGVKTLFLGGGTGGKLKMLSDISIVVPESETYKVQELHLPIYHTLCAMLEEEFFA
jgi:D-sedoheptulose 7-phosphate isomerase